MSLTCCSCCLLLLLLVLPLLLLHFLLLLLAAPSPSPPVPAPVLSVQLPAAAVVKLSVLLSLTLIQFHLLSLHYLPFHTSLYNFLTNSVKPIATISLYCSTRAAIIDLSMLINLLCVQRKVKKEGKWLSIIAVHFMVATL